MKWKHILNEKRNVTLILFSILLIVVMIGYMHKEHLSDMDESITSIYEDRLVAKDYIFDLSQKIATKKAAILNGQKPIEEITMINHEIVGIIDGYEKTKLTDEESVLWGKLKNELLLSIEFEDQIIHNPASDQWKHLNTHLSSQYDTIFDHLKALSDIQLYEGKKLLEDSKKVVASNSISNRLEIALIIIVLMAFMIYSTTPKVSHFGKVSHN